MGGGRVAHSEHDRKRRYALAAVAQHVDIALFERQRTAQRRPPRNAPVVARCVLGPGKPGIAPCRKGCGGPELAVAVHGVGKRLAKLRVGVEVRATNRRDGERPGDFVLAGKEPYRGFAAQHPTEEVRKVPTKRVDEPQAGNGDASRACHQTPCPAVTLSTIPSRSPTVLGRGMSCGILTPSLSSNSNSSSRSMSESTLSSSSKASGVTRAGSMFSRLCRNSLRTVRLSGFMIANVDWTLAGGVGAGANLPGDYEYRGCVSTVGQNPQGAERFIISSPTAGAGRRPDRHRRGRGNPAPLPAPRCRVKLFETGRASSRRGWAPSVS